MQTLPRKITKPSYFAPQSIKAFVLCSAKLKSNADFAPRSHRDRVSGAKITAKRLLSSVFFLVIFGNQCYSRHCCIVVHINVFQQQNIFLSWMNRPSDDSSRRIIPVQFWELMHTFKHLL